MNKDSNLQDTNIKKQLVSTIVGLPRYVTLHKQRFNGHFPGKPRLSVWLLFF